MKKVLCKRFIVMLIVCAMSFSSAGFTVLADSMDDYVASSEPVESKEEPEEESEKESEEESEKEFEEESEKEYEEESEKEFEEESEKQSEEESEEESKEELKEDESYVELEVIDETVEATNETVETTNEFEENNINTLYGDVTHYTFGPGWKSAFSESERDGALGIYFVSYNEVPGDYVSEDPSLLEERDLGFSGLKAYYDGDNIFIKPEADKPIKLVGDCSGLFSGFENVRQIKNIGELDTSEVTNMDNMFSNLLMCDSLDLHTFDTSNVQSMESMFEGSMGFRLLLAPFNTSSVTNMSKMFKGCSNLEWIIVEDDFVVSSGTNTTNMFEACVNLYNYDSNHVDGEYARIDSTEAIGYFIQAGSIAPADDRVVSEYRMIGHPTKKVYNVGDEFDLTGISFEVEYTNGDVDLVEYSNDTKIQFRFISNTKNVLLDTTHKSLLFRDHEFDINFSDEGITVLPPDSSVIDRITVVHDPKKEYVKGEKFNPDGMTIHIYYTFNDVISIIDYDDSTKANFSFEPSLDTELDLQDSMVKISYLGLEKSAEYNISVVAARIVDQSGHVTTYVNRYPSGGSGGGGGGGGGGGRGSGSISSIGKVEKTLAASLNSSEVKQAAVGVSGNMPIAVFLHGTEQWVADPTDGSYKLLGVNNLGQSVALSNGFAQVVNIVAGNTQNIKYDTYYFDEKGKMVTGWLQTSDNKTYFFENEKGANEGKMTVGWKKVADGWYYFSQDGSMLLNGNTPDGYFVGATGEWQG